MNRRRAIPSFHVSAVKIGLVQGAALLLLTATPQAAVNVEILGVSAPLKRQISATVEIATAKGDLPVSTVRNLHRRAPEQIKASLQPLGYYRVEVQDELVPSGENFQARYHVQAGEPLRVTRVDVRLQGPGGADSNLIRVVSVFPLRVGDTLRHDRYETGKKALADCAAARGYLDAAFDSSQLRIDLEAYTSEVVLHFSTGPRYLYGPVTLHQDVVDTLLLVGYIPFREGDSLELSGLRQLQENLGQAIYFSQAQVDLRRDLADGLKVPVEVQLLPRKTQRYEFGVGYGTDTGIRGRVEVGFRRLNRRGHNATLRLDASEIERSLSAEYKIPPAYPRTALWTLGVGVGDFSPEWSTTRALRLSVTPSRILAGWRAALGLSLEADDFEISVTQDTSILLVLRTEWDRIRADDIRQPTHGSRFRLGLRGAHDNLLSTATFWEASAEARGVITMLPMVRLVTRGQAGYVGSDDFAGLPPSARYVTGGSQTVRGYEYETLGPRDEYEALVGGQVLMTGSVEMDFLFLKKWGRLGVAGFVDAGNASSTFDSFRFELGAGGGLRWASPVGMLRLDLGWPLDHPESGYEVHFSMGPDL